MPVGVRVSGIPQVRQVFNRVKREVQDLTPQWPILIEQLIKPELVNIFLTDGLGKWQPRKDNLPHPLLRKSYNLFNSVTQNPVTIQLPSLLTYGTNVPYAQYHEEGTATIPPRPFFMLLDEDPDFDRRVGELIDSSVHVRINRP